MTKMSYKTFTWPENPGSCQVSSRRVPEYNNAGLFSKMGPLKKIISGEGVFAGPEAYKRFQALQNLMNDPAAGTLKHPILGDCSAYLSDLKLTLEPAENYVAYSFSFQVADGTGTLPA